MWILLYHSLMDFMDEMDRVANNIVFSARKLFTKTPPTVPNDGDVDVRVSFDKTSDMIYRLRDNPFFEEATPESRNGIWQGRNIIGRDVPINGGVYLGGGAREAIVVDDNKQPRLDNIYRK